MAGWFEDCQREKDDEAARRGAEEAKNEGILGSMLHEVVRPSARYRTRRFHPKG